MATRGGCPRVRVVISPSEQTTLEQWARRRTTAQGWHHALASSSNARLRSRTPAIARAL